MQKSSQMKSRQQSPGLTRREENLLRERMNEKFYPLRGYREWFEKQLEKKQLVSGGRTFSDLKPEDLKEQCIAVLSNGLL